MNSEIGHSNLELVAFSLYFIFVAKDESSTDARVGIISESVGDSISLVHLRQAPSQVESHRHKEKHAES